MKNPHENKVWYKKKRYIILALFLGLIFAFSGDDVSTEQIESVSNQVEVSIPTLLPEIREVKTIQKPAPAQNCHPSYSGCLNPNAGDYDCAGGSGNGPYYTGTVQVYGYDEYDLDRDNDGWGCE